MPDGVPDAKSLIVSITRSETKGRNSMESRSHASRSYCRKNRTPGSRAGAVLALAAASSSLSHRHACRHTSYERAHRPLAYGELYLDWYRVLP